MVGKLYFLGKKSCILNLMVPKIYPAILLKGESSKNSDGPHGPDNRSFSLNRVDGKRTS